MDHPSQPPATRSTLRHCSCPAPSPRARQHDNWSCRRPSSQPRSPASAYEDSPKAPRTSRCELRDPPSAGRSHLDWEGTLHNPLTDKHAIAQVLNWIYVFGHWPVIALTMLWLLSHHQVYIQIAAAMLLSSAIGLVLFAAFPVPPLRLAGLGVTDTTLRSDTYHVLQPTAFVHQYTATPGFRVAWSLLSMLALLAAARKVWARVTVVTLTLSMNAAVVLTVDHYMLNVIEGAVLATVSWHAAGRLPTRKTSPASPNTTAARTRHLWPVTSASAAASAACRCASRLPRPDNDQSSPAGPATVHRLRPESSPPPESQPAPLRPAG
ncbi:phosphatase PAP2 family protein [Streptomyces sp. NPDC051219]|uniref:phosphatase PAP2 family protein n=1 Tax=Streptomyces sp. NPDC051219 TaxID=3155283 RepID=UPI003429E0B5